MKFDSGSTNLNEPPENIYGSSIRPRAQLIKHGAAALSSPELLELFLRTGKNDKTANDIAQILLKKYKDIRGIAEAPVQKLAKVPGVGPYKAAQLQAALELGRRMVTSIRPEVSVIDSPEAAANMLYAFLAEEKREHFIAMLLDIRNRVTKWHVVSIGTLDSSLVHPREVFREAIAASAASIIIAHNHPSGDPSPSPEDKLVTKRLVEAGKLIGIDVLDHIVLGDPDWISFKTSGLM